MVLVMASPTRPGPRCSREDAQLGQEEQWAPHNASGRILPLPGCCSCPPWGRCAGCRAVGCPTRHRGMRLSPVSLIAGDAAHRPAGPRILRFALGHAVRMLPEPAASSRDERSQPVPSCGMRPATEPPGPCSAVGRRRGGKAGRKNLAFGRLRSPPSRAVLCLCASLFSSFWLMTYLGSLRCSSVSAFRFGFIDLSWGLGRGGSFVSFVRVLSPPTPAGAAGGTEEGPPPRESFRPRQPRYFAGYFFPPWPFLQSALGHV